jgi:hypothetical protein
MLIELPAKPLLPATVVAEAALASGEGPASRRGRPVRAEYVIYARLQNENRPMVILHGLL